MLGKVAGVPTPPKWGPVEGGCCSGGRAVSISSFLGGGEGRGPRGGGDGVVV